MQDYTKISTQKSAIGYDAGLRSYMLKVYNFMAAALGITGVVAYLAGTSEAYLQLIISTPLLRYAIMFAPLGVVLFLGFKINSLKYSTAQAVFWAYSALMGLSLSFIFMAYTGGSIAKTFFVTAGTFGAMSLYGYTTKKDLSGWGSFLIMGLFGLIIASIVNIFLKSSAVEFALSIIGVLVFVGLTAYDTQRIKQTYYAVAGNVEMAGKAALYGALQLYLDFINLFIYLLRFMGDRK